MQARNIQGEEAILERKIVEESLKESILCKGRSDGRFLWLGEEIREGDHERE